MKSTIKPTKSLKTENPVLVDLLAKLDFEDHEVLVAACSQPALFMKAADYRVECMRKQQKADAQLDVVRAEMAADLRKEHGERGEKIAEKLMNELLDASEDVQTARAESEAAKRGDEYSKLLVEAYRHRRDALRIVADMMRAEEISQRDGTKLRKDLDERFNKKQR